MEAPTDSVRLRIFVGETARHGHQPLYEAIVMKARELHLAGATVLRGSMGYGKSSLLHTSKVLSLSDDLPVVVEIVDAEEKIDAFMKALDQLAPGGLATLEKVRTVRFGGASPSA